MITFLPDKNFHKTAQILDYKRLGKQRVEAYQILNINLKVLLRDNYESIEELPKSIVLLVNEIPEKGKILAYENHPAVLMWRGYELALARYGKAICEEWINRGYHDNLLRYFTSYIDSIESLNPYKRTYHYKVPFWWGDEKLHSSHRAALLYKNLDWYSQFNWTESPMIIYYWPVRKGK